VSRGVEALEWSATDAADGQRTGIAKASAIRDDGPSMILEVLGQDRLAARHGGLLLRSVNRRNGAPGKADV
jgi:hypothetical protein